MSLFVMGVVLQASLCLLFGSAGIKTLKGSHSLELRQLHEI